jgi:DNA-binding transcriptional ArsR family regulator
MNTNQLRIHLDLDYRTVKHHLEVLEDNDAIYSMGSGYGSMYFLTSKMEDSIEEFDRIWDSIIEQIDEECEEE